MVISNQPVVTSPEINKFLRKHLSPLLRESGFTKVAARKAWAWKGHSIAALQVRAIGSYASDVSGWPPASVCVWTGVYYDFIPFKEWPPKHDDKGRLIPDESYCHMRSHLSCSLDQSHFTKHLSNPAERVRKDVWWFERDGSNMELAVENIALAFLTEGRQWFDRYTEPANALAYLKTQRDCYVKFYQAEYLTQHLGLHAEHKIYQEKRIREQIRIGLGPSVF